MPLYEYECQECGKQFEELQGFKDKPLIMCRFCGGAVRRLISQTSFSLKGDGWYKDGYANKKPAEAPKAKGPEAKPASGSPKTGSKNSS